MGLAVAGIKFLLLIALTQASRGPNKLQRDLPDSFKIFQAFENPIGMIDTNNDSVLECLSARRAEIDPETQTATYVWSLAGDDGKGRKYIPFYHSPGRTPDETRFSIGSKNRPRAIGHFLYTDYMNCAILEIPYHGDLAEDDEELWLRVHTLGIQCRARLHSRRLHGTVRHCVW
ncbi:uncharacterized protein LOC119174112 isoform X2 [Rhipicephalus microplus]|uniref:uncharacterized protein LOC119174112 isoform X2 n=1 Tax=Rhipicephalus microplus TaxID=6941 RepID=UPI003F6D4BA7